MFVKVSLFVFGLLVMTPFASAECDFEITKVNVPLKVSNIQSPLCLDQYFELRNMGSYSIGEGKMGLPTIFRDTENIQFDDMILFDTGAATLGEAGRLQLVKKIYASFLANLRNEFGKCTLHLYSDKKELSIDDFIFYERDESGQPGSRLMLRQEDVIGARWEMLCPSPVGVQEVEKSGDYFFIFVDVHENIGTLPELQDHLAKFLFSLR